MSTLRLGVARRALLFGTAAALTGVACFDAGLGTGTSTPGAGGFTPQYTVEYSASASGDGTIAELRYFNPEGVQVIVLDPVLPFSIEFTMGNEDVVGMAATGDVTTGTLQIELLANRATDPAPTPLVDKSDSCTSDGSFIVCELSIPSQSL